MIRYIRNNIITIKEAIGLDIHFLENDRMIISGVHLKQVKGQVKKVKDIDRVSSYKELHPRISKNMPVAVSLNGKGVLQRVNQGKASENLIGNLLPGVNPQDFLYTIHDIEGADNIIYVARKELADSVIKSLEYIGVRLLALTLGSNPVDIVAPFFETDSLQVVTPTLSIKMNGQKVVQVDTMVQPGNSFKELMIGGESYSSNQVLALGNTLSLLSRPGDRVHSDIRTTEINYLQKDFVYYKLFQFAGWATLVTTLTLLLINFFVFNHYFSKNKALVQDNALLIAAQNSTANTQVDSAYNFYSRSGWNSATRHGYYMDRIAALAPSTVSFRSMEAAPLQESIDLNDYVFSKQTIQVTGTSIDPTELETFSRAVKNIAGVQGAAIKNYLYQPDIKAAVFTIEVTTQ